VTLVGHTQPGQGPVTAQVAERRLRVVAPVTATALGGLVLALAAATLTLTSLMRQFTVHRLGPGIVIVLIYAGVGVVIARRQPVDLGEVQADLVGVVHLALEPAHISLWTRERGG
jgi:hypothetical protein